MKVLLINTSERIGGAAIAAHRLMEALKRDSVRATMLVRDRQTQMMSVTSLRPTWLLPVKFLWERFVIFLNNGFSMQRLWAVDIANAGTDITHLPQFQHTDVVHLHWVNQAYLSLGNIDRILRSGKPIVVTMHDMWYFTGICHYAAGCNRYHSQCTKCPQLGRNVIGFDLAKRVFNKKRRMFANANITFVGCSRWMADMAAQSALTKGHTVVNIPNAIDTGLFKPGNRDEARRILQLPLDKQLLLFGAQRITDHRKGFRYLAEACALISQEHPEAAKRLAIVVVGADSDQVKDALPFDVYPVNYISDEEEIVKLYNAVDAYVTPSLQDNLPNTIVEALACGIPCIGFEVGGIPEMIDHQQNGYVARYRNASDFAYGILWTLDESRHATLSQQAREKAVQTYSEPAVARQYEAVYSQALGKKAKSRK